MVQLVKAFCNLWKKKFSQNKMNENVRKKIKALLPGYEAGYYGRMDGHGHRVVQ
jgi:hypothetical protein